MSQILASPKIATCGAHGTGKTTLVRSVAAALAERGIRVRQLPEVPRVVCEQVGDPEYFRRGNNSLAKQLALLTGQCVLETERSAGYLPLLCDRTILDHWAYTTYLFGNELDAQGLRPAVQDFVVRHLRSYDLIFYLPPEFPPVDDGTREGDVAFRDAIAANIEGLLADAGASTVTVRGTLNERTSSVLLATDHLLSGAP